jgi:DNA-binding NarL/FixJ family response regulator
VSTIDPKGSASGELARAAKATVIAGGSHATAIVERLGAHGLRAVAFERAEETTRDDSSVVVLLAPSPSSALADSVALLAERFEGAPIVVVCESVPRWALRSILAHGAAGVVLHDELDTALIPCVRAVLAGQACVPQGHRQQIEPPALSAREKQILGLVVMGYMNGQIAEQLFLAESTVKSHLSSAFRKLGVRSRNEAVNLILDRESGFGVGILALGDEPAQAGAGYGEQPNLIATR